MFTRSSCTDIGGVFAGFSCMGVGGAGSSCSSMRIVGAIRRPNRARSPVEETIGSVIMNEELGL